MKICSKCGIEKEKSEFGIRKERNNSLNSWCKECYRNYKIIKTKEVLFKICGRCKIKKDKNEFIKSKQSTDGLYSTCNQCRKEKNKISRLKNSEKIKERSKIYAIKNSIKIKENSKIYTQTCLSKKSSLIKISELLIDDKGELDDEGYLTVECSHIDCNVRFRPSYLMVKNRIKAINGIIVGESRFYCSQECKNNCERHNFKVTKSDMLLEEPNERKRDAEVQKELREMRLEIDNNECQICGNKENLHCHHIEGINYNPIESSDVDACITLCSSCHNKAHSEVGCRYSDLRCKIPTSDLILKDNPTSNVINPI